MGLLFLCLDLTAQNVQYKVNHADAVTTYTPEDVASDFGARLLPSYDWHGGVDYSPLTGNQDRGYTLLALEDGTISHIHNLAGIGFKYLRIDGAHHFGYGHIFTSVAGSQEMGDFKIVKFLPPYSNLYGIFNTETQQLYYTCKDKDYVLIDCSKFKYREGNDTILATNQVLLSDEIGPMGTSINGRLPNGQPNPDAAVEAHLHLYNFSTINDNTASDISDVNTLNPLQFADHTAPTYIVNAYKDAGFTQQGIGIVYPGTERTQVGVRASMANQSGGSNYSAVMDVNRVKLSIRKDSEPFTLINGLNYESRIDYGGRTDAAEHYPAGKTNNTLKVRGRWKSGDQIGINGVRPRAYDSAPYDDFYFTDFVTRIHKNHESGESAKYADFPSAAKYNDGKYDIEARMTTVTGAEQWDTYPVTIDNFMPYLHHVQVNRVYPTSGPAPSSPEAQIYHANSAGNDPNLSIVGDGKVSFSKNVLSGCWQNGFDLIITVYSSEPLQYLNCKIPQISNKPIVLTSTDNVLWVKRLTSPSLSPGVYTMEFQGSDLSGNPLLNIATYETGGTGNKSIHVPTRIGTSGSVVWSPNPTSFQKGKDTYHQFTIDDECRSGEHIGEGSLTIRDLPTQCPSCLDYEDFTVYQERMIGDSGKTSVTLNYPVGLVDFNAIWKNASGEIIGTGNHNVLPAGDYCIDITYNECCQMRKCFRVEGCGILIYEIILPECIATEGPYPVSVELEDGVIVQDIVWSSGEEGVTKVALPSAGSYSVTVSDIFGCQETKSFTLNTNNLVDSISASLEHLCENNIGGIFLDMPQGIDTAEGWAWTIVPSGIELEDVVLSSLPEYEFSEPGSYELYLVSATGCDYKKKYELMEMGDDLAVSFVEVPSGCDPETNYGYIRLHTKDSAFVTAIQVYLDGVHVQTIDTYPMVYLLPYTGLELRVFFGGNCYRTIFWEIPCCQDPPLINDFVINEEITPGSSSVGATIDLTLSMDYVFSDRNYVYQWTGPDGFVSYSEDIRDLSPGRYCVTVTDGCYSQSKCIDICNVLVDAEINNGCGPASTSLDIQLRGDYLDFSWDQSQVPDPSSLSQKDLADGTYTLIIHTPDNGGCTTVAPFEIFNRDIVIVADSSCGEYFGGIIECTFGNPLRENVSIEVAKAGSFNFDQTMKKSKVTFEDLKPGIPRLYEGNIGECFFQGTITVPYGDSKLVYSHTEGDTCYFDEYCNGSLVAVNSVKEKYVEDYWESEDCSYKRYCGSEVVETGEKDNIVTSVLEYYGYLLMLLSWSNPQLSAAYPTNQAQSAMEHLLGILAGPGANMCHEVRWCPADLDIKIWIGNLSSENGEEYYSGYCLKQDCFPFPTWEYCPPIDFGTEFLSCNPIRYNVYQLIVWMPWLYEQFPEFVNSSLEAFLTNHLNDKRAKCAFVTFCDNFQYLYSDINIIDCYSESVSVDDSWSYDEDGDIELPVVSVTDFGNCHIEAVPNTNFELVSCLSYWVSPYYEDPDFTRFRYEVINYDYPNDPGDFFRSNRNPFGKKQDESLLKISGKVSTNKINNKAFVIYPNPFSHQLQITYTGKNDISFTFELFNVMNELIFTTKVNGIEPGELFSIDLSDDLPSGIYFAKLSSGKNKVETYRLIKIN